MMDKIIFLACLACLAASHPSEDIRYVNCDPEIDRNWPEDLRDDQILHASNSKRDMSGPFFKIYSQVDVRKIVGGKTYLFELSRLSEQPRFQRFLISIESVNPDGSVFEDIGELKSLSDLSEHLSYRCPRYLVERSTDVSSEVTIPFAWEAPKEGCVEISALVLDTYFGLYAKENDYFSALKIVACVDPSLTPHEVVDDSVVSKEISDEDNLDDNTQVDTIVVANSDLDKNALKVDNLEESVEGDEQVSSLKPEKEDNSSPQKDKVNDEDELGEVLPEAAALIGDVKEDKKVNDDDEGPAEMLPVPAAQIGDVKGHEIMNPNDEKKGKKAVEKPVKKGGRMKIRRKGQKLCCKSGIDSTDPTCSAIPDSVIAEAQTLIVQPHGCRHMFELCCKDKKVGEKKLLSLDILRSSSSQENRP